MMCVKYQFSDTLLSFPDDRLITNIKMHCDMLFSK